MISMVPKYNFVPCYLINNVSILQIDEFAKCLIDCNIKVCIKTFPKQ